METLQGPAAVGGGVVVAVGGLPGCVLVVEEGGGGDVGDGWEVGGLDGADVHGLGGAFSVFSFLWLFVLRWWVAVGKCFLFCCHCLTVLMCCSCFCSFLSCLRRYEQSKSTHWKWESEGVIL